jgi:hypothetical protein
MAFLLPGPMAPMLKRLLLDGLGRILGERYHGVDAPAQR